MADHEDPDPEYKLPPGSLNFTPRDLAPIKKLALAFLRERCYELPQSDRRELRQLATVRIGTATGVHRRAKGTWKTCCFPRIGKEVEPGTPFAAFKPDSDSDQLLKFDEIPSLMAFRSESVRR